MKGPRAVILLYFCLLLSYFTRDEPDKIMDILIFPSKILILL